MCSNYDRFISDKEIIESMEEDDFLISYDDDLTGDDFAKLAQQNIRITDDVLIVKKKEAKPVLSIMKWGIAWNPRIPIFNSRIETIRAEERWRDIFEKSRCLIPATSFFEFRPLENDTPEAKLFKKQNKIKKKSKFGIAIPGEKFFFIGGIYVWDKGMLYCSMITTDNHPDLAKIPHHRSPYLIEPKNAQEFLEADPLYLLDNINVYDKSKSLEIKQVTEY